MLSEDHETIYHLTPRGWEPEPDPPDRVETWRRSVNNGSISWRCIWVNLNRTPTERDALRQRYRAFMV